MAVVPLKVLADLPPARSRHQAARDMLAEADRIDGRIMQLECDGGMFCNPEKVREWRALKNESGKLVENACAVTGQPIERLRTVLFDEDGDEGRAA